MTERVIERVEPRYITVTGIDEATLARKLAELENKLRSVIALSGSGGSSGGGTTIIRETADLTAEIDAIWRAISLTNKIDKLGNVTLRDVTFEGTVTGLTDSLIPDSITASNYLPLAGGELTGDLTIDTNVFVVDTANDRVGIGTTSPYANLSVTNTGSGPSFLVEDAASPDATPFVVDADGSVGIGTSSPTTLLHLYLGASGAPGTGTFDTFRIEGDSSTGIDITTPDTNTGRLNFGSPSNSRIAQVRGFYNSGNPQLSFWTDNTQKMTIGGAGNVGIGTTSPYAKLSITQTADTSAGGFWLAATDGDHRAVYMDTSQVMNFEGGSGNTATLDAAGVWTDASDIAYKENLSELSYGFKELMELKPRSYTMKGSGSPQIGFIAQEIELVLPEVVSGEEGKKGVAYGHVVPVIVKAMEEQSEALFGKEEKDETRTLFERFAARVKEAIAGLAELFVPRLRTEEVATNRLCVGATCVTETELKELLGSKTAGSGVASSQEPGAEATASEDLEPPVIEIHGANPAVIEVGVRYSDNGARVTDNVNDNLGYTIMLDGEETKQVELDTSEPGTHEITYTATDQAGNTANATRIVEIVDPAAEEDQDDSMPPGTPSASAEEQSDTNTSADPAEEERDSEKPPESTSEATQGEAAPATTTPEGPAEQTATASPTL